MGDQKVEQKPLQKPAIQAELGAVAKAIVKNPAPEDGWYYHQTHEPRLIKKGEEIPEGFGPKNIYHWYKEVDNNFHWRKK